MELRELNYIIAIAEEGSISKAAERLFMAQSSLSQFLSNIERELETKLFVRTSTGVRPTEEGRLMLEYAYQEYSEYHRLRDRMQDIDGLKGGRVILGISTFRGTFLLPEVMSAFKREYPGIHVIVVEENSIVLEQMLRNGAIDLALITLPPKVLKAEVEVLMHDEICIITSPTHPVMRYAKPSPSGSKSGIEKYIDIRDTIGFEYLLCSNDTVLGREGRKFFREHGIIPKVYNDKLSAFFAATLGAEGLGLAFTYYCAKMCFPESEFLSLGVDGAIIDLGVCLAPGRYHSKAAVALKDIFFRVLGTSA